MTSMIQPELFPQSGDHGTHLSDWWTRASLQAIEALAQTGRPFSASDLRDEPYSIPEPVHPNHWGALWTHAKGQGLCHPIGYVQARTGSRHRGVQRLWLGGPAQ